MHELRFASKHPLLDDQRELGWLIPFGFLICCWGNVDYALGMVTRALGDLDAAVDYFEHSAKTSREFEAGLYAAHADVGLADALLARGQGSDAERAATLQKRSLDAANQHDWPRVAKLVWEQRLGHTQK